MKKAAYGLVYCSRRSSPNVHGPPHIRQPKLCIISNIFIYGSHKLKAECRKPWAVCWHSLKCRHIPKLLTGSILQCDKHPAARHCKSKFEFTRRLYRATKFMAFLRLYESKPHYAKGPVKWWSISTKGVKIYHRVLTDLAGVQVIGPKSEQSAIAYTIIN